MLFRYGHIEEALADLHGISSDGRGAFRARLRHLKQLGFPAGTNTGKGQKADYSFVAYMQLVFALELSQSGFAPKRTIGIVEANWARIEQALFVASTTEREMQFLLGSIIPSDVALVMHPDALSSLGERNAPDEAGAEVLNRLDISDLPRLLLADVEEGGFARWRALIIMVKPLIEAAMAALCRAEPRTKPTECWDEVLHSVGSRNSELGKAIESYRANRA